MGSSPLTRGKPNLLASRVRSSGLIPTHAGKTSTSHGCALPRRAHPHSRGENRPRMVAVADMVGSSPLTRGKPASLSRRSRIDGLIPTHAGKTRLLLRLRRLSRAHPHSRGENPPMLFDGIKSMGSSPLTRGKLWMARPTTASFGLIPTHAGKTRTRRSIGCRSWAHPHSRGENPHGARRASGLPGSSPLTRGKPGHLDGHRNEQGLIPTHAGKTSASTGRTRWPRAHPHSRGENRRSCLICSMILGSSPLTRGKLQHRRVGHDGRGLIPTHAGKTRTRTRRARRSPDHPHSRGENPHGARRASGLPGSSPLTRGKPLV